MTSDVVRHIHSHLVVDLHALGHQTVVVKVEDNLHQFAHQSFAANDELNRRGGQASFIFEQLELSDLLFRVPDVFFEMEDIFLRVCQHFQ